MRTKEDCPCTDSCPMNTVLKIIGGKWKIKILCVLNLFGPVRYNTIKRKVSGINSTMLAESLRELEELGIVWRRQYDEMPVRVEYSLTDEGKSIIPILVELREWSLNLESTASPSTR